MFNKNSIITKTTLAVSIMLVFVFGIFGWYVFSSQQSIIEKLQKDKKQTILKYIRKSEKEKVKRSLQDIRILVNSIVGGLSDSLYNSDIETAKNLLYNIFDNKSIKIITIFDTSVNELFLVASRTKKNKIIFTNKISPKDIHLEYFKFNLKADNEEIGYVKVYFDITNVIAERQKLKQKEISLFNKKASEINKEVQKKLFNQIIIGAISIVIIILLIMILLKEFVNKPLVEFQKGLNSFFEYLANPTKKVQNIQINTKDEFGQMTKSVNNSIKISMKMHSEMAQLMLAMDKNVITTETDGKGIITYVSEAFCKISGFSKEELIGKSHNIVRHPDMSKSTFQDIWKTLKENKTWIGEIKNRKKDGGFYWVHTIISPKCTQGGDICGYTAIRYDITAQKKVEELTANLEIKIAERTKELNSEKKLINSIINSQDSIVVTSDGKKLTTINKAFKDFYGLNSIKEFEEKYGPCICDSYEVDVEDGYLTKDMDGTPWIKYVLERPNDIHKVIIKKDDDAHIFTLSIDSFMFEDQKFVTVVLNDITELEKTKKQVEAIHKHTRESIEYASLIQGAVVAQSDQIRPYFKDSFVTWTPKDTVGGDIWLFNDLRHEDECLLMFIDCTGHGVPGAFVTMIVKAVEREVVGKILEDPDMEVSPAWVMSFFNKTIKKLLKQENKDSVSNAGWDGGIIYYNRKDQILKFAGAETPLFYITKDGKFNTIKGNRYSVGYKKCDASYQYKETIIQVEEGMKFFCTTDGYLDQNGGEKDFPFGKKRFSNIIKENYQESMSELQTIFMMEMMEYENAIPNNDRNDDMTVIGFEIGVKSDKFTHKEILKYEGIITQNVVATSMDNIEDKIKNIGMMGKLSTLSVELLQNMMNYSKDEEVGSRQIVPAGYIHILQIEENIYEAISKNIVSIEDKEKIEPKLIEIQSLDEKGIKKRYRELRKSGQNTHDKGGGIGFYEIAKLCKDIEYQFTAINEDKYYFKFIGFIHGKSS